MTRTARVTIDLRGLAAAAQLRAAAERTTVAALARRAIAAMLSVPAPQTGLFSEGAADASPRMPPDGLPVKITVRISAAHAVTLATRAHAADVPQGTYVTGLLDNAPPPPRSPDYGEAVRALLSSTDQLAVLSADLNAFMRLLERGNQAALEPYRASVMSLNNDVQCHLTAASRLMSELKPARRKPCGLLPGQREGASK